MLITLILALVAVALWHLPVSFLVRLSWPGAGRPKASVTVLGFLKFSRDFNPGRRTVSPGPSKDAWDIMYLKRISRGLSWRAVTLSIRVGLGDAAATGMTVGSIWAVIGPLVPLLSSYLGIPLKLVRIQVYPDFKGQVLEARASFSFTIKMGRLLYLSWQAWRSGKGVPAEDPRGLPRGI
ncbi:MAG: DUF2953 domain-containing protein [Bacillota bacterium]